MPIYEFRCKDCGKVSEFQMKMSDPNPIDCPGCGHAALSKIMSLPSFQLKGGGWYADAYDGKSNKSASSSPVPASESAAAPAVAPAVPSPAASAPAPAAPSSSPSSSAPTGGSKT